MSQAEQILFITVALDELIAREKCKESLSLASTLESISERFLLENPEEPLIWLLQFLAGYAEEYLG